MTRLYIQPSWIDSCSDHGEWSGGNDQYRGDKSIEAVPTYINGKPNVKAFSDEAIEARREKKKTSIPLVDRVLPQQRRVRVLTEQLYELEAERKNGMDIHTYSQLRDILICKRLRAEELLKKATSVKPLNNDEDDLDLYDNPPEVEQVFYATNHASTSNHNSTWVDDLPNSNSLKLPLQKTLQVVRTLVRWHQAARNYINELKVI